MPNSGIDCEGHMMSHRSSGPDLTRVAPRSPWARLGNFTVAARVLDKCRAEIAGTNGEYHFNCPVDRLFFGFAGISAIEFRQFVSTGADDAEVARWLNERAQAGGTKRALWNGLALIHPGFVLMRLDDWMHARRARG